MALKHSIIKWKLVCGGVNSFGSNRKQTNPDKSWFGYYLKEDGLFGSQISDQILVGLGINQTKLNTLF